MVSFSSQIKQKKKFAICTFLIILGLFYIVAINCFEFRHDETLTERGSFPRVLTANPPSVNITNLNDGDVFEAPNTVLINATIEDDDTSVSIAKVLINSSTMSLNLTMEEKMGTWSTSWDNISKYELGIYTITVWASDENGEINMTQSVNIELIDTTNPFSNDLTLEEPFRTWPLRLDWILYDNYESGGEYRVWCRDPQGDISMVRDWSPWTNGTILWVDINTSIPGIFNYTIEYRDGANLYGLSDSVIVNVSDYAYLCSYYNPTIIDLNKESGISLNINVSSDAVLTIDDQSDPFSNISKVNNGNNFARYYHIRIFNWTRIETSEMLESAVLRFYYQTGQINALENLRVYRFDEITESWTNIDYSLNSLENYVEITITEFSYLVFFELEETLPMTRSSDSNSIDPFLILIILVLSAIGLSAVSSYTFFSRKNKKKFKSKVKRSKYLIDSSQSRQKDTLKNSILEPPKTIRIKSILQDASLTKTSLKEIEITNKEVSIQEKADICQVHRGPIEGLIFSCPRCKCKYCLQCAMSLEEKNENCWSCNEPLIVKKRLPILKDAQIERLNAQDILDANIAENFREDSSFIDMLGTIESSLTVVSKELLEKVNQIPWESDLEKERFLEEMLSYTPVEQEDFINEMLGDTLDLVQGREGGE